MKMIAHRGFSARYPENTLLAFTKAMEAGVDGIETDLRLSKDAHPVLFHDDTLERLTGNNGCVEELTLLADTSGSESTDANKIDIISNGFKARASNANINASGGTYIFASFASNPFKTSRAR